MFYCYVLKWFKKFGAEKRHVEFAKNRCGKKKPVAVGS